jgi:hypothetical protein
MRTQPSRKLSVNVCIRGVGSGLVKGVWVVVKVASLRTCFRVSRIRELLIGLRQSCVLQEVSSEETSSFAIWCELRTLGAYI